MMSIREMYERGKMTHKVSSVDIEAKRRFRDPKSGFTKHPHNVKKCTNVDLSPFC